MMALPSNYVQKQKYNFRKKKQTGVKSKNSNDTFSENDLTKFWPLISFCSVASKSRKTSKINLKALKAQNLRSAG